MRYVPNKRVIPLALPPPVSDAPSVMAFSLAKAGSTLLYNMLTELSGEAGLVYYSVENTLFGQGVGPNERPARVGKIFSPTGYCYGGFRQFPLYPIPILKGVKSVFLVRDPRDMIVSLYFSLLKSHSIPAPSAMGSAGAEMRKAREKLAAVTPDDFATDAVRNYVKMFEGYLAQGFHYRKNVIVYRYEDVIYEKEAWLKDLCAWYEWQVPEAAIQAVAQRYDIVPDEENAEAHVRQVKPGNYKQHLNDRSVNVINRVLKEYMTMFGYA